MNCSQLQSPTTSLLPSSRARRCYSHVPGVCSQGASDCRAAGGWFVLVEAHRSFVCTAVLSNIHTSQVYITLRDTLHYHQRTDLIMNADMVVDDQGQAPDSFNPPETPRFSRFLNTVLGSPFLTVSDLPLDGTWREGFAVQDDLEAVDGTLSSVPRAHTITRPTSPTPSFSTDTYSFLNWTEGMEIYSPQPRPSLSDAAPHCSFLPAPTRRSAVGYHPYPYPTPTSYNTLRSPNIHALKPSRSFGLLPRLWDVLRESSPGKRGRRRTEVVATSIWNDGDSYIDYANLPPLDGEEGELIDDEACFINVRAVTGIGKSRCLISNFLLVHGLWMV